MRKLPLLGLLALLFALTMQPPASAWINFKFGAGINWNWQSGGNNTLWGLFRNGQPPGFGGCDPACIRNGAFCPFNIGACPPYCAPPFCGLGGGMPPGPGGPLVPPPFAPGPAPMGACNGSYNPALLPNFGFGHYYPHEFQYFGQQGAPNNNPYDNTRQNVAAYNPYTQTTQSNYYSPYSSSSYYGNWSGYPYGSSGYYSPYGGSNYNYYDMSPYYYSSYQANPPYYNSYYYGR